MVTSEFAGSRTARVLDRPLWSGAVASSTVLALAEGPVTGRLVEREFPEPDSWGIDGVRDVTQVQSLAAEITH